MFQQHNGSQFDDEDYAFNAQKRAKDYSKKMTAIAYDTSALRKKGLALQPILVEKGRSPTPGKNMLSRTARMAQMSSEQADLKLSELYRNTIEEFKRKLYEQKKAPAVLSRINERIKQGQFPNKSISPLKS